MKLPRYLQDRWNRTVDRWLYGSEAERESYGEFYEGSFPPFSEFCKFVNNEARIACGPGLIGIKEASTFKPNDKHKGKSTTLATSSAVTEQRKPETMKEKKTESEKSLRAPYCNICTGSHNGANCKTFMEMTIADRKAIALKKGVCFNCLRKGHLVKDCRRTDPSLLFMNLPEENKPESPESTQAATTLKTDIYSETEHHHSPIVPVIIHHKDSPEKTIKTYAVLDNQSNGCFMTNTLAKQLHVENEPVNLQLTTMLKHDTIQSSIVHGLVIRGVKESVELTMPGTYTRERIPVDKELIPKPETLQCWPHLKTISKELSPYESKVDVGLLVGYNCSAALLPRQVIVAGDDEPFAVRTILGWGITGTMSSSENEHSQMHSHFAFRTQVREVSPNQIKEMYDHDFNEVNNKGPPFSYEDQKFLKQVKDGIRHQNNGHYELPLPFKNENPHLPNNKDSAMKRFNGLRKKLLTNEQYRTDYLKFMNNLIEMKHAERVPHDELQNKQVWYLPHHGVYHPKKPDKLRVVFDCSAEYNGQSLNNHLLQGPDQINSLTGVLCRFRQEKVAFVCDIEGMFHQVNVAPEHRDYLRFLWSADITSPLSEYRMTVHLFGATSSPGCAMFALRHAADDHEKECGKEAADFIRKNFYVDDGLKSTRSVAEAQALVLNSIEICKKGGFTLHQFVSTDRDVLQTIPTAYHAKDLQKLDLGCDRLPVSRTLGIEWCVEEDEFRFHVEVKTQPATRRAILSTVSSVFDPLGLLSPFLLTGRMILQRICRDGCSWDDPIPDDLTIEWNNWKEELTLISQIRIARPYRSTDAGKEKEIELHHFSDASMKAYGQCSYLRIVDENGKVSTSLVMAKSRVAPSKTITVPRLELMAAVLSVKIAEFLNDELDYDNIRHFFWTDSQVVLGYIANETRRFHVFVANRIQQIRNFSNPEQWYYVNTSMNPADLTSRGMSAVRMAEESLWWRCPNFLSEQTLVLDEIPANIELSSDDPEVKKSVALTTNTERIQEENSLESSLKYFSTRHRARKAIAVCLRFKQKLLTRQVKRTAIQNDKVKPYQPVNIDELKTAETVIIKDTQQKVFHREIKILQKPGSDKRKLKDSRLFKLDPFICDAGLIRVGGRVKRSSLDFGVVHPVIIPKESYVAKLLIAHFHEKSGHSGANTTLNEIRASGYWILQGISLVSAHVQRCVMCRKLRGHTQLQKMADLPEDRLEPSPPFTYSAVDLFGPFLVKEGRSERKRWGAMFVCMVSRAIHIEVVTSLTTDSFINAYRRFISRRGPIRQLRCDRGTNFVGAKNELDAERIRQKLLADDCDFFDFKMNFPHASHMGGAWERMIRSARNALSSLLASQPCTLDDELLHTLLLEAEAIVNSRPLTYINAKDASENL